MRLVCSIIAEASEARKNSIGSSVKLWIECTRSSAPSSNSSFVVRADAEAAKLRPSSELSVFSTLTCLSWSLSLRSLRIPMRRGDPRRVAIA